MTRSRLIPYRSQQINIEPAAINKQTLKINAVILNISWKSSPESPKQSPGIMGNHVIQSLSQNDHVPILALVSAAPIEKAVTELQMARYFLLNYILTVSMTK